MRVLFDQGTPVPLRQALPQHSVETAFERGWSTLANGALLAAAEADGFDVMVTTDHVDITCSGVRPGEKLYEEVFFGHEAVEPTSHPKVLRSPADAVSDAKAGLIETLIQTALSEPDNWVGLKVQLRALVPDFHVPPPPPAVDDAEPRISGEQRKLRLA